MEFFAFTIQENATFVGNESNQNTGGIDMQMISNQFSEL